MHDFGQMKQFAAGFMS